MRLKELRTKLKMTQSEVARILEINVRNYNRYENELSQPDIQTLIKLANFFNTSIDEIVGRETKLINLNALKPVKKKLVEYCLQMNDNQEIKAEAYLEGLMENK